MVEFTRVLCPLDFSEPSSRALKYAAAIARSYGSELVLQHVLPTAITFAWTPDVANQPAAHAILEAASTLPADLVVMGAQGSGGLELMLYGSNTHHVVRNALCPVLTVRS